jgi:cation diffusion facilitator family transporter
VSTVATQIAPEQAQREKQSVALASVLACLVLVIIKMAAGLASNSLGVLSEAVSSSLDLMVTLVTYFSVRVAGKPADADHQYGHGKFENLSALLEAVFLLLACGWIVWEALDRLFRSPATVEASWLIFLVLFLSLSIDLTRSRALARVARKYGSQALEADALHFSVDMWTTVVVLLGLAAVWAGDRFAVSWLRHADPVAALVVAASLLVLLVRLARRSADILLDTAPAGLRADVEAAAGAVEGVLSVDRVRTRRAGNRIFVDVTTAISRTAPFERVHDISDRVEDAVRSALGEADVVVHMEPRAHAAETLFDNVRAIAQRHDLQVHELSAHEISGSAGGGRIILELDAEVDEDLSLRDAHALTDQVEKEIYRLLPEIAQVHTHIETLGKQVVPAAQLDELARALAAYLHQAPAGFPELIDCHNTQVRHVEGKVVASCHATLDGSLPITRVHDITKQLEKNVLQHFPQLYRLTVHTEPPEER